MKRILFITNGHGEDIVAAQIIKELANKKLEIEVLPVVGKGDIYRDLPVRVIGPKKALPSGGFGLRNYSYLIRDLFSGLIGKAADQIKLLMNNRFDYALVIGIGDIVPIIYSMITGCSFIFVGVNKSDHYRKLAFNYTRLEKALLRKYCRMTLARDMRTAKALTSSGINAKYVGNPMMDAVPAYAKASAGKQSIRASEYQKIRKGREKVIGFLPGTREDAYKNIEDFNKIAGHIKQIDKKVGFIMSIPSNLDRKKIAKIGSPVKINATDDFNKVLNRSRIMIGLSGTGNEQAAGIGIPVIAFPGRGAQFNSRFAAGQKELLGDALMLLPRNSKMIAREAVALLRNKNKIKKMAKTGITRMGRPGASKSIADIILKELRI